MAVYAVFSVTTCSWYTSVDDQRRELQPCLAFDKLSSNLFL